MAKSTATSFPLLAKLLEEYPPTKKIFELDEEQDEAMEDDETAKANLQVVEEEAEE